MKNIMLLGDSIRMFYQKKVVEKLGEDYNVWGPDENVRFARYTQNSLRFYLAEFPNPDVIHWNNGLWDIATLYPEDGCFTPLEEYISSLKIILRELKRTGAEIIFATSTPVADEKRFLPGPFPPRMLNEDIVRYNEAAVALMKENNIRINDLHKVVTDAGEGMICDDLVHPTPKGVEVLSDAVSEYIKDVCSTMTFTEHKNETNKIELDEMHKQ